jgi:hypothetical protein
MLLALLYCEFDNKLGPRLKFQVPDNFLTPEQFAPLSTYTITKRKLCGFHYSLKAYGMLFLSFPVYMQNEDKYHRNALLFNCVFVLKEDTSIWPWVPVIRKLSVYLTTFEQEMDFLQGEKKEAAQSGS